MKSFRKAGLTIAAAYVALVAVQGVATAKPGMMKQAKDAGVPASNCQYCHTDKMPKKETYKPEELTDRGKWLLSEKDKRKAAEVDGAWLKDYKEQK